MKAIKILASSGLCKDGIVEEALNLLAIPYKVSYADKDVIENISDVLANENAPDYVLVKAENLEYPLQEDIKLVALLKSNEEGCFYALVGSRLKNIPDEDIQRLDIRNSWGEVFITGFGPGDALLMTKMAEYHLLHSDVIFYDDLVNEDYLKRLSIPLIYVGKRKGKHKFDQQKINALMLEEARKGKSVVRIKGGDPLLFGRGAEEYHYLQENFVKAEIIPGISSAFAAASSAVIPLTERSLSSSVTFLSGHDLNKLKIPKSETLVFYMGASNQSEIAKRLLDEGWHPDTPVAIVHCVSKEGQKEYRATILELSKKGSGLPSPSIIIVGKTAKKYSKNASKWMYTGLNVNDWERGEDIVHTPMVRYESLGVNMEIKDTLGKLRSFDRIIFKSRYSVEFFMEALFELGLDVRALADVELSSIGKRTSAVLRKYGLLVKPFSKDQLTNSFLTVCKQMDIQGENILIPGSDNVSSLLEEGLRELNNKVTHLVLYKNVKNDAIVKQNLELFKGVIFTSPVTVSAFLDTYGRIPEHLVIESIGTRTRQALEKWKKEQGSRKRVQWA